MADNSSACNPTSAEAMSNGLECLIEISDGSSETEYGQIEAVELTPSNAYEKKLAAIRLRLNAVENAIAVERVKQESEEMTLQSKIHALEHLKGVLENLAAEETNIRVQYDCPSQDGGGTSKPSGKLPLPASKSRLLEKMEIKQRRLEARILAAGNAVAQCQAKVEKCKMNVDLRSTMCQTLKTKMDKIQQDATVKMAEQNLKKQMQKRYEVQRRTKKEKHRQERQEQIEKVAKKHLSETQINNARIDRFFAPPTSCELDNAKRNSFEVILKMATSAQPQLDSNSDDKLLSAISSQSHTPKLEKCSVRSSLPMLKDTMTTGYYQQFAQIRRPIVVRKLIRHNGLAKFFYGPVNVRSEKITVQNPFVEDDNALNYAEEFEDDTESHESIDFSDSDDTDASRSSENLSCISDDLGSQRQNIFTEPIIWGPIFSNAALSDDLKLGLKKYTAILVNANADAVAGLNGSQSTDTNDGDFKELDLKMPKLAEVKAENANMLTASNLKND